MQPITLLWLALPKAEAGIGKSPTSHFLTDASGLQYQVVDDFSFTTTYGYASGACLEAGYTTAVTASTASGGTAKQYLGDAFDGYGAIFVDGTQYALNGPSTSECGDRQLVLGTQVIGDLSVWRKVYVPDDDAFARMIVFVANDGATAVSTTVAFTGNLGSDGKTKVMATSSSDAVADVSDDWAVSMEDFYYKFTVKSGDPRLGHVWQNGVGSVVADELTLTDGNDSFHWRFSVTIPAGQTIAIMTFVTGQPTVAAAQLQAETLVGLPPTAVACLTEDELASVANFGEDCSHLDDQCNVGVYDLGAKACVATPSNEGGTCDDGDACTLDDVCGSGTCAGTAPAEVTGDGIDEDCDGGEICWSDADDDGHAAKGGATVISADTDCDDATEATDSDPADDCDDDDAGAYPGATEIANDDVDQDCDGADLVEKADDTGGGDDAGGDDAGGDDGDSADDEDKGGCSCAAGTAPAPLWALALGIIGLAVRRRR
jgi:MYXO-CTERM domain-containing protein